MSEEEKNALKCLEWDMLDSKQIEIILNLIDKQQKEIKELERYKKYFLQLQAFYEGDYIRKDKIREKIKEVSNGTYDAKIILEKLLEE